MSEEICLFIVTTNSHKAIVSFGFEIILWRIVDFVSSVGVNLYFKVIVSIIFYLVNNDIY